MPVRSELIASGHSVEEVREIIGADRLIFQDLDDLIEAVGIKVERSGCDVSQVSLPLPERLEMGFDVSSFAGLLFRLHLRGQGKNLARSGADLD